MVVLTLTEEIALLLKMSVAILHLSSLEKARTVVPELY